MKAYLCKITLKDSKPPYWWRCNIPAGISFSALSILLDQLIGEETPGSFSFEVHDFARIWEPSAEMPLCASGYYSAYDAAHTPVDQLLPSGKPVNYLRNGQVYQIRVESIEEEYPFSYPMVLKSPRGTDTYALITKMQEGFILENREVKRPRNKESMLSQVKNGVLRIPTIPGLPEEGSPYCKESAFLMLRKIAGQVRAFLDDMERTMKDHSTGAEGSATEQYTLREILDFYKRDKLEEFAKTHDVQILKRETKEEAVGKIAGKLLNPDVLYRHFVSLTDDEMNAFEEVMNAGGTLKISPDREDHYDALIDTAYVFYSTEDLIIVGTDVMDGYRKINNPEFHARRRKVSYLRQCLNTIVPMYYSMLPVRKFIRICRRTADPQIRAEEVQELLSFIPDSMHDCVIRDDTVYSGELIRDPDNMDYIRNIQKDKPYCIIKEDEIDEILHYGYPQGKRAYREFREYLLSELKVSADTAETVLRETHRRIALTYRIQKFYDMLKENGIIPTQKQAEEIMKIYMSLVANTRTVFNRGYTPDEMSRINGEQSVRNIRLDDAKVVVRE